MPRQIDSDAEIDSIRMKEQSSAPATPDSGYGQIYCKSDGLYYKGDDGVEVGPLSSNWTPATNETWTYASADDPTFTFTISGDKTAKYSEGMRIKLTQTTDKFFIITKVVYSDPNTTVTVYGGTDYDLANATITSPYYSREKAPHGFPLDPLKWMVTVTDTSDRTQSSPAQNTWYNLGSVTISIPIGCWNVSYQVAVYITDASSAGWLAYTTLSTANDSESDVDFTAWAREANVVTFVHTIFREKTLTLASKTPYYLNTRTTSSGLDSLGNRGDQSKTIIQAVCAYL